MPKKNPPLRALDAASLALVRGGLDTQVAQHGGLWDTMKEWGAPILGGALAGATTGALAGSVLPGVGNLIGAGVGAVTGAVGGMLGHQADKTYETNHGQSLSSQLAPEGFNNLTGGAMPLLSGALGGLPALGAMMLDGGARETQPLNDVLVEGGQKGNDDGALKQVVQEAQKQGATPEQVEEMVTLYHISNSPSWAKSIAEGKSGGKKLDELARPINPDLSKNNRKNDVYGDGRGGDDLGPGFYTGNSPNFVDKYAENYDKNNPASVLQFQVPKKALDELAQMNIAKDDEASFQQYMKDGFATFDTKSQQLSHPKLDTEAPKYDLLTGPINDIKEATKLGAKMDGDIQHSQGSILTLPGGEVPLQYNFATKKGVEALYGQAKSITSTPMDQWTQQREAAKKGNI